jgi:hypothetical protein
MIPTPCVFIIARIILEKRLGNTLITCYAPQKRRMWVNSSINQGSFAIHSSPQLRNIQPTGPPVEDGRWCHTEGDASPTMKIIATSRRCLRNGDEGQMKGDGEGLT